jgi:hypothetical protein
MGRHDDSGRRYRDKAEELGAMKPHTADQNAREILEQIASNSDLLASRPREACEGDRAGRLAANFQSDDS